ncbi:MAG TPA: hypothetical protein VF316_12810, partial [Polyangiaceae bacterium]
TGAVPYAELRKLSEKFAESSKDKMSTLHYWGQFTDKLPAPFKAEGGHHYLTHATEEEARAKLAELCRAAKLKLPTVEITEDDEQTHFLLSSEDDEEEMWAELSPKSEYDASWQANAEEESWIHAFGGVRGLFWDVGGPGVADVGVSADGTEIVLVRSWVDEDEDEEEVRALVDAPSEREVPGGEVSIPSGKAVVIWSPIAPFQLTGLEGPDELAKLGDAETPPELDTELIGGVGTVLRVKPGRWIITTASTDEDESSWSCRWIRLRWVGEA